MTENKRFYVENYKDFTEITLRLYDEENKYQFYDWLTDLELIVDLLNKLHEVNQQLEKEIKFLQKELRDCSWKTRKLTLSQVEDAIEKIKRYE